MASINYFSRFTAIYQEIGPRYLEIIHRINKMAHILLNCKSTSCSAIQTGGWHRRIHKCEKIIWGKPRKFGPWGLIS